MFSIHEDAGHAVTFHFDAEGETPRRWHCSVGPSKRWDFTTDMCHKLDRKPGIPTAFKGKTFETKEDAIAAVLALN